MPPFGQGSQGWLSISKGLPRDLELICFTGAQIGVRKGAALSSGGTDTTETLA